MERHIHKLPLGVTPPFDPTNTAHQDVVAATESLLADWDDFKLNSSERAKDFLDPNNSKLHIRRRKIKEVLASLPSWEAYENACKAIYCVA